MAIEKLLPAKFAKIKSRQEALQTTFSVRVDIFYSPNFGCFEKNGLFQQPQAFALLENCVQVVSAMAMLRQPLFPLGSGWILERDHPLKASGIAQLDRQRVATLGIVEMTSVASKLPTKCFLRP